MKNLRPETRVLAVIVGAVTTLGILVVAIVATAGPVGPVIPPAVIVDTATPITTTQAITTADRARSTAPSPAATGSAPGLVAPWMLQAVSGPSADEPAVAPLLGPPARPNQPLQGSAPSPSPAAWPTSSPQATPEPTAEPVGTGAPAEAPAPAETATPAVAPATDTATPTSTPEAASPTSTPEPSGD